jgi:peroxiredoxin
MRSWTGALATAAIVALAGSSLATDIGDKAPPLTVKEWVQGDPVKLEDGAGKKVYVVEFWATWCPPCRESIPHLSKMAERLKDKGLEVIGISGETVEEVRQFAKDGKFRYHVAVDDADKTGAAYMRAFSVTTIPHAFVVDRKGAVVWHGNPMPGMGLEEVVEQVLADKFDAAKAKVIAGLLADLESTFESGDAATVGAAADKLLAADPSNQTGLDAKMQVLKKQDDLPGAKAFVAKHAAIVDADWHALNFLAVKLSTDDDVAWRDMAGALKLARRAVEVSQGKESRPLETLAHVYFEAGLLDLALETQKKAVSLDDAAKPMLAYYESCAALRAQVQKDGAK